MKRTLEQNTRLHKLIGDLGITKEQKQELVEQVSYGRVSSSADLTRIECDKLLDHLQNIKNTGSTKDASASKMRRKVMSIAHDLKWETPSGDVDYPRLEAWLLKFGYLHKKLNAYKEEELPRLVTQLEKVLATNYNAKN